MPSIKKLKADGNVGSKKTKSGGSAIVPKRPVPDEMVSSPKGRVRISGASSYVVKSASVSGFHRNMIVVSETGREIKLTVPRMAIVGPNDTLHVDPSNSGRMSVRSTEDLDDLIPVTPHFERHHEFRLGTKKYEIVVKELITQSDVSEYEYLEGFHYKTSSAFVTEEKDIDRPKTGAGGRKGVLIAYVRVGKRLVPAGYIELQMPLLMTKPRHVLFAHGFHHPSRQVAWEKWDAESMRKYVNLIVRIARVVTSPDLRGLGLARILIGTAKEYAKERWQIGGRRPLFMEISAEMLKYMDFTTSAGLHFIGNTEGNLSRVHKDLIHMDKGQKISFGMMTLQKKYLTQLQALASELGRPFPDVLERLKEITKDKSEFELRAKLNSLEPQEWYLFKSALRFPIPYFMCGLDQYSEEFISSHASPAPARLERATRLSRSARIGLKDIRIVSTYEIPDSAHARAVRDCFGLDGSVFRVTLVGPISIEASGGNIVLITGPSGSGKSLLLRALDRKYKDDSLTINYRDLTSTPYEVAWMNEISSDRPLIEYFSEQWGIESSISALNLAGLSEAFIYLRPYKLLSRGQQYRARLAALSLGHEPVWLMDEFCADLDPFTARIVANNLRRYVIRTGRIAVIAAANNIHYIDALKPTQIIYLRPNGKSEVLSYKEYIDEFCIESQ